jgi:hypothetical protein
LSITIIHEKNTFEESASFVYLGFKKYPQFKQIEEKQFYFFRESANHQFFVNNQPSKPERMKPPSPTEDRTGFASFPCFALSLYTTHLNHKSSLKIKLSNTRN